MYFIILLLDSFSSLQQTMNTPQNNSQPPPPHIVAPTTKKGPNNGIKPSFGPVRGRGRWWCNNRGSRCVASWALCTFFFFLFIYLILLMRITEWDGAIGHNNHQPPTIHHPLSTIHQPPTTSGTGNSTTHSPLIPITTTPTEKRAHKLATLP